MKTNWNHNKKIPWNKYNSYTTDSGDKHNDGRMNYASSNLRFTGASIWSDPDMKIGWNGVQEFTNIVYICWLCDPMNTWIFAALLLLVSPFWAMYDVVPFLSFDLTWPDLLYHIFSPACIEVNMANYYVVRRLLWPDLTFPITYSALPALKLTGQAIMWWEGSPNLTYIFTNHILSPDCIEVNRTSFYVVGRLPWPNLTYTFAYHSTS